MRFVHTQRILASAATLAALATLAACATGTATTASGTTPTTDVNAPAGPATNTGRAVPGSTDTTKAPPSGAANSVTVTGTGNANTGAGVTPGTGNATDASASGTMLSNLGGDAHIVSAVDIINTGEIAEGMLARQHATLPQIRDFANRMVQEHTDMQTQDRALAKDPALVAGDTAEVARNMMHQSQVDLVALQKQPAGAAFDALYLDDQIKDHQAALDLLNAAKTQARNGKVKDLVTAAIPKVQAHLDAAKAIRATMTVR